MIPYGKDNWRRNSDVARGEWLAARGYALCRVDVRGTGSSGGIALDEYTADETQDGYEAVEWLAAQPWCSGDVAMWGISYGGFTSIQVAKLQPPHLRAIVPIMATDDRYRDDVHYRGGCLTVSEQSQYSVSQVGMNAMPPDAGFRGPGWRDEWLARLEATPPWTLEWLRHQTDGPYYRQGSLAPDYDRITCRSSPTPAGTTRTSTRPSGCRSAARRRPNACSCPAHGAMACPIARSLVRRSAGCPRCWRSSTDTCAAPKARPNPPPRCAGSIASGRPRPRSPRHSPGSGSGPDAYPIPGTEAVAWQLAGGETPMVGRLLAEADANTEPAGSDRVRHRPTVGTAGTLSWGAGGAPNGLARDLRPDEALSLTYTSEPLTEPLDALGFPEVVLHLEADAEIATVAVRLTDVAPDGTSAQVSAGILNLTHRHSDEHPEPLVPGRVEEVRVPLRALGYRWLAGHRIQGQRRDPVLADHLAVAPARDPHRPSRIRDALPLGPAGPHRRGQTSHPPGAAHRNGPTGVTFRGVGSGDDHPPVWRIDEDVVAGSVTVHVYEGGTTVLETAARCSARSAWT